MHLAPTDEQAALAGVLAGLLEKESSSERVRAAEPDGFDARLWSELGRVGVPDLAGGGPDAASLADLVVVGDQAGRRLATAPLAEVLTAVRAIERLGRDRDADALVTFAPLVARHGRARLVIGAAVADGVLALDGDRLVLARGGPVAGGSPATLAALAQADVATGGAEVLAEGADAAAAHAAARVDWWVLTAATLVGIGRTSLDLGVAYVKDRHQFGVPIGSFQAVQHQLADVAAALDGAELLVREAAWLVDGGAARGAEVAAMAYAFAGQVAQDAAGRSLHLHGGYGYMLEYDIQLFFRRAKALVLAGGDPLAHLDVVADLVLGPVGVAS